MFEYAGDSAVYRRDHQALCRQGLDDPGAPHEHAVFPSGAVENGLLWLILPARPPYPPYTRQQVEVMVPALKRRSPAVARFSGKVAARPEPWTPVDVPNADWLPIRGMYARCLTLEHRGVVAIPVTAVDLGAVDEAEGAGAVVTRRIAWRSQD